MIMDSSSSERINAMTKLFACTLQKKEVDDDNDQSIEYQNI